MPYDVTPLFEKVTVKGKTLRNRIVLPPMVVNRGLATKAGREWYAARAKGGVALVIVEATNSVLFGKELTAQNLRPLVDAIRQGGALAAIQLFPFVRGQKLKPADLSREDIARLLDQFRLAADICAGAGFDGMEPHGAHNYLLNQFFSPAQNLRTDEYNGSSLEGRMRLALQIVDTIAPAARQAGMLLLYRHTPVRNDYGIEDSLVLARALLAHGVDILDISPASDVAPADRAAPFVTLNAPVIAVNNMNQVDRALEALREKRATLIAVGRALIADPEWPNKVREGREKEIVDCLQCGGCMGNVRANELVVCPEWDR
jgi:2,4-dienoyl-CoA reductase-like NADH-dependent reductase (Old Yellow Enzyme family)